MKRKFAYIFSVFCLLISFLFFAQKPSHAYLQSEGVCYSQCAAYKFVWKGDYCYDLFTNQCGGDEGNTIVKTIKFLKGVYDLLESGEGADNAFKAWFICKPLIENCIAPQLASCHNTCQAEQSYYAPNLSVGSNWGSADYQGIYYDDVNHNLIFKVINNGLGYASDIDVSASWGHTRNKDLIVSGGGTLFTEKIPELLFLGARVGAPKTPGDYVTDFLIDQSNFAKYLQGFKSDANNHYVPPAWYKVVPFTAPAGEYTKIILNVDPNKMIPESSETDNTFILEINNLPLPANFEINNLTSVLSSSTSLTDYMVSFEVKNNGEENGNAHVKWYLGKYEKNKTPLFQQEMVVQAKDKVLFDHPLTVDASKGGDSCNYSQNYTLVIFDDDGVKQTEREFSVPLFAGSISGRVMDLFNKKVVGATVITNTGQSAVTNSSGYYHIRGIPTLGKVTVTATHPDFSKEDSKEVEIKFDNSKDKCHVEGLSHNEVDFILKDQDVLFTVTIKDTTENPVTAQVVASSSNWRFNETINGSGPLPGMQPGKYTFTISAPGYKTISQDINAVPNDQNLEFTLEKLNGRPNDDSLHLITPTLLWKKTLGSSERIIGNMTATKNGKLLVISAKDTRSTSRSLFFLDFLTGKQIKEVSVPSSVEEQRFIGLDASYDGGTVALVVNPSKGKIETDEVIKVFDATGNEIGSTTLDKKLSIAMDVSPDGFYLCPYPLLNKGLHKYTKHETEGKGDDDFRRNPAICGEHFLRNNNFVDNCNEGLCEETIANQKVRVIGDTTEKPAVYDSTFDSKTVVARSYKKLYYFGSSSWNKELDSDNDYKSVAVSPGGMFTLVTEGRGSDAGLRLKVFGNTGGDKTPDFPYKDVKFVFANDKGLFFVSFTTNKVSLYQIGKFDTDYNPQEATPTPAPLTTSDLSYYDNGSFHPAGSLTFSNLTPGTIYIANSNINLNMTSPYGILSILEGTLFSVDNNQNPVLLKGQLTADFNSPATIYAIKFDRYDLNLFQTKLTQFRSGTLPESEYFIVKNIHTKFVVKNEINKISVAVDAGQVQIFGKDIEKTVNSGKQIAIDQKNKVEESMYLGSKIYLVLWTIIILAVLILAYVKRKTILKMLKKK
jgi:hypothetical protein